MREKQAFAVSTSTHFQHYPYPPRCPRGMLVSKQAYRQAYEPAWQGVPTVRDPVLGLLLACAGLQAQVSISGRVVDENGAGIPDGARGTGRRGRRAGGGLSDLAGNFRLNPCPPQAFTPFAPSGGLLPLPGNGQRFDARSTQLTIL